MTLAQPPSPKHLSRDPAVANVPAVSTIWRILKRRGFVIAQPHKRPRSAWKRFEAAMPNQLWQADVTHWHLADGHEVEILNLLDDHSRIAIASLAQPTIGGPNVMTTFTNAFAEWGTPASVLTDNGAIFTATPAAAAALPCRWCSANSASNTSPAAPITRRPAARLSASTKPSKNTYARSHRRRPSPTSNTNSTHSWPTTTPSALFWG
jgi:hypothetical protein